MDITFFTYLFTFFASGIYIAISPCLFPILPLYLIRLFNADLNRNQVVKITIVLVLGIIVAFTLFTLLASFIALFIIQNLGYIQAVLGVILVIIGLFLIVPQLKMLTARIPVIFNYKPEEGKERMLDVFIIGLGYAFIAAPCSGPVFIGNLLLIVSAPNLFLIMFYLLSFSVGVMIPYLIFALATQEARMRLASIMASNADKIEALVGIIIIIIGILFIIPIFGGPIIF